ncbi:hypothetical protein Q3P00_25175, partial [Ralstonia pseudosolanacearum]|nr:hypothetical protein [Ralstonia pseudosolanacearum]
KARAWKDIWGAGQGVGQISDLPPAGAPAHAERNEDMWGALLIASGRSGMSPGPCRCRHPPRLA